MRPTATLPRAPHRFAPRVDLLSRLLDGRIEHGQLIVETPDGRRLAFGTQDAAAPRATWRMNNWAAAWRLLTRGALGLAEGYLEGDWDTPDLRALLRLATINESTLGGAGRGWTWLALGDRLRHRLRANSKRQARRNIAFHYDLGNAFYAAWLDETMTYSSAVFDGPDDSLESAQGRKYARLAALAGVEDGARVLEIGCGWGGFMQHAAQRGCDVTGISISAEQCRYASDRMAAAGLEDRARVQFRDYRDLEGHWPHIVSIEMFEALGEAYWPCYAERLARHLQHGGGAALQVITIEQARFERYRNNPDFIQRYVFPGGMLPSEPRLVEVLADAGLTVVARHAAGLDYARTLASWRERFDRAWPRIEALGFDARFKRLWHFYLAYCEAGFRAGSIDVVQLGLRHSSA